MATSNQMQKLRKFGFLLREHRQRREIPLGEVAQRCDLDLGNYSRIEQGQRKPPERPIVVRICQALGPDLGGLDILELLAAAERERYSGYSESELLDVDQYRRAVAGEERTGPRILPRRRIDSPVDKLRRIGKIRNPAFAVTDDLEAIEQIASVLRKKGWRAIRILTRDGTWEEILYSGSSKSAKRKAKP